MLPVRCKQQGYALVASFLLFASNSEAQPAGEFDALVEQYVAEGLRSNLALRSETLEVEKAAAALAEARARFFPELSLQARYTQAEGGREFTLPLRDRAESGLLHAERHAGCARTARSSSRKSRIRPFSSCAKRNKTHESSCGSRSMRPRYPAAVRAQSALLDASNYQRMALARTLRRDITIAYLDWLKARSSVDIVAASETLLHENLRVNESLFDNGKSPKIRCCEPSAELLEVEQQKREVENLATTGAELLQLSAQPRSADARSSRRRRPTPRSQHDAALEQLWTQALERRPEVGQHRTSLQRASAAQVRARTQAAMADAVVRCRCRHARRGLPLRRRLQLRHRLAVFTWRLFDGGGDAARVRQARATERQLVLAPGRNRAADPPRSSAGSRSPADRARLARDSAGARRSMRAPPFGSPAASAMKASSIKSSSSTRAARSRAPSSIYNLTRFNVLARRAELEYATSSGDLPLDPGV